MRDRKLYSSTEAVVVFPAWKEIDEVFANKFFSSVSQDQIHLRAAVQYGAHGVCSDDSLHIGSQSKQGGREDCQRTHTEPSVDLFALISETFKELLVCED